MKIRAALPPSAAHAGDPGEPAGKVRTLFIAHSVISLTLAGLLVVFWRGHRSIPGLGHWTVGATLLGVMVLAGERP